LKNTAQIPELTAGMLKAHVARGMMKLLETEGVKMHLIKKGLLVLFLFSPVIGAQESEWYLSTFAQARANGDAYVSDAGDVYISDFGNPSFGNGSTVVKITPDGQVSTLATGLSGTPTGVVMDQNQNLYVAALNAGVIYRIGANGSKTTIATGLSGPVGLAVDPANNLYVAECSANRISRIVNGQPQTVASIPGIGCANGLVWGHDDALYTLMWRDGKIYRVGLDGDVSLFAATSGGGGHLEYLDGYYYVLGRTAHKVYRVDTNGEVELLAGTGMDGTSDGPALEATISRPNGIGVDRVNKVFYIAGSSSGHAAPIPIRKLSMVEVNSNDFRINYGLVGSWFNPITNGQGMVLDFAMDENRNDLLMYWFTHDISQPGGDELSGFGSDRNRWFTLIGAVSEDSAVVNLTLLRTASGQFNQPATVVTEAIGEASLEFFSCVEAEFNYTFETEPPITGSIPLTRITPDVLCESLTE
jgi:sugar lactone lactonase YvrE